jgi:hypothetical protein
MNKLILSVVASLILACAAYAGEAKLTWQEPDNYTDIREGHESRDAFREKLFSDFELIFADLAKRLPQGYVLEVTVTDVDLAGEVSLLHHFAWRDIRIFKDIYFPRMSLKYTLKDRDQRLLLSGSEDIKDMGFLFGWGRFSMTRFGFEERMLRNWFKKNQREGKFPLPVVR